MEKKDQTLYARRIPVLGRVQKDAQGHYFVEEHSVVAKAVGFVCPGCGKPLLVRPAVAGRLTVVCKKCATPVAFIVDASSPSVTADKPSTAPAPKSVAPVRVPVETPAPGITIRARLVFGHWPHRREVPLREGTTVIGRCDAARHSDVEIDDPKASVRSVAIIATARDCRIQVLRATNPVFVNGIVLSPGGTVCLTKDAAIRLGDTIIRLKIKG